MSDCDESYGPPLPPGFANASENTEVSDNVSVNKHECNAPKRSHNVIKYKTVDIIGPSLPSEHKQSSGSSDTESSSCSSSDSESNNRRKKKRRKDATRHVDSNTGTSVIGPVLPKEFSGTIECRVSSDSDCEVFGPSLDLKATEEEQSAVREFEKRSQKMANLTADKNDGDAAEVPIKRESWMTELPSEMRTNFGLTSRQFRRSDAPEMDSSWTDGPSAKGKSEYPKKRKHSKNDCFTSELAKKAIEDIKKYNKQNRPESLLEMHRKELKKKKKKEKKKTKDKSKERRPFDRDVDLKVNRLDDAKRRALIKKSQELGTRFASGGTGTSFL